MVHVRLGNAIHLMAWADLHSIDDLKEAALEVVVHDFKHSCQTEKWEHFTKTLSLFKCPGQTTRVPMSCN